MRLLLLLLLLAPVRAVEDPLARVPGWVQLFTPTRILAHTLVLVRRAEELKSTAPLALISEQLEQLRGLEFRYPVRFTVKTPEGVRAFLESEIATAYPKKRMRRDEKMLELLGLVPEGFQLEPFLIDLLTEQIAGAYDPDEDYFFVVLRKKDWLSKVLASPEEQAMITLHELDHAMQNQHFDLRGKQLALARKADSDHELAFAGLVEGDATSVMYDLVLAKQGMTSPESGMSMEAMGGMLTALPMPGMGKFREAPLYFQRQLMFPYLVGCDFVNYCRLVGGWDFVDSLYADLPVSTEQVYHPERYLRNEQPLPLKLDVKLPGWEDLGRDTGGEFTARVFLEQHGVSWFKRAAEGWGNDKLAVFTQGDRSCLVWLTRWDSPGDAEEFELAAREALEQARGRWKMERRGDRVLLTRDAPDSFWRNLAVDRL